MIFALIMLMAVTDVWKLFNPVGNIAIKLYLAANYRHAIVEDDKTHVNRSMLQGFESGYTSGLTQ